jgi:hypothetical protein
MLSDPAIRGVDARSRRLRLDSREWDSLGPEMVHDDAEIVLQRFDGVDHDLRFAQRLVELGAGERLFNAPLTIEPMRTTTFSRGAVAHVFAAHP